MEGYHRIFSLFDNLDAIFIHGLPHVRPHLQYAPLASIRPSDSVSAGVLWFAVWLLLEIGLVFQAISLQSS